MASIRPRRSSASWPAPWTAAKIAPVGIPPDRAASTYAQVRAARRPLRQKCLARQRTASGLPRWRRHPILVELPLAYGLKVAKKALEKMLEKEVAPYALAHDEESLGIAA